jgi:hypothetical protein
MFSAATTSAITKAERSGYLLSWFDAVALKKIPEKACVIHANTW